MKGTPYVCSPCERWWIDDQAGQLWVVVVPGPPGSGKFCVLPLTAADLLADPNFATTGIQTARAAAQELLFSKNRSANCEILRCHDSGIIPSKSLTEQTALQAAFCRNMVANTEEILVLIGFITCNFDRK